MKTFICIKSYPSVEIGDIAEKPNSRQHYTIKQTGAVVHETVIEFSPEYWQEYKGNELPTNMDFQITYSEKESKSFAAYRMLIAIIRKCEEIEPESDGLWTICQVGIIFQLSIEKKSNLIVHNKMIGKHIIKHFEDLLEDYFL
jgi:hypothetical protein